LSSPRMRGSSKHCDLRLSPGTCIYRIACEAGDLKELQ